MIKCSFLTPEQRQSPKLKYSGDILTCFLRSIEHYFLLGLKRDISRYPISYESIRSGSLEGIVGVANLLILAQVECEQSDLFLQGLLSLSEPTKAYVAQVVEAFKNDERIRYLEYSDTLYGSAILNNSGSTGIEYDRENRQHFADKDRMIDDQNRIITSLQSRIDEYQKQLSEQAAEADKRLREHNDIVETYGKNIAYLEEQVRQLSKRTTNASELEAEINNLTRELNGLQISYREVETQLQRSKQPSGYDPVELNEFLESGGVLSGRVRDNVILTLKDQLAIRDEEINFHRDERMRSSEQFKKTEKLLVSAIHSIALRYHEEMVSRSDENNEHNSADSSQSMNHGSTNPPYGG